MRPTARLHVAALDADVTVPEAVRRLAGRRRVTAWSGAWSRGGLVTCDPVRVAGPGEDPFALLATQPVVRADPAHPDAVGGGWFGYLSFPATRDAGFPRASLGWYRDVLRHDGRRWWYEALLLGDGDGHDADADGFGPAEARRRQVALERALRTPATASPARLEVLGLPDETAHVVAVERCVQAIRRGDIYQANIATEFGLRLTGSVHDAWARLVEALGPARAGFVADPAGTAISASPELFLHRDGRTVRTEPIKGTRPRTGASAAADEAERLLLRGSEKDAAENVMIVDLMRNDLSRVCAPGSVTVPRLLAVEPHPGVWHLVSEVRGKLAAGCDDAALLAAAFPPGSVTGAPKVRAVELIEELEGRPRGLFTGALGYAGPLAGLELAVAIRTLEVEGPGDGSAGGPARARLGVGGGVTVDSTPAEEWAECLTKAAPLLRVLGDGVPWAPTGTLTAAPRPRPADGLFETLLVIDGHPQRLADHLRRLRRSYWECYGHPLTADVAGAIRAAVGGGAGHHRVRVDAVPGEPDRVEAVARPCDPPVPLDRQPGLVLRVSRPAEGVAHKFADRRWLDDREAGLAPGTLPLLVDAWDRVLESTRSNVFLVRDGVVATPPLDGRVLPGTARQAVLDALDTRGTRYEIGELTLDDLARADGVFLTNAIRGLQWVRAVDGLAEWPEPDAVIGRLAKVLT
ncbi:chorismate-binding protein [Pseudonocardia bannensis]|uniref:Bifunctional aminodeoxychorismate synthase component I/aminodeoxychorismate lyase n=1 Tax=Pseudonocardia bannensis TaxID=630973 RepID=A0A848DRX2_9PSEU|nr:bifunctional anthranilate synthase component I family protein/class IV aminotransferase [Pseudonocardia bannensis]NMH95004.1 bifunctional aminodeoxychorismate synthase component I/aminodeoxychorismate lyase [Pseudonocardia bannensis]